MIKWRDKDIKKLKKTIKNFNAKITRESNKNPYIADLLPQKQSYKELKNKILERTEFNQIIRKYERFNKRKDATKIIRYGEASTTLWQKKETLNTLRSINAKKRANPKQKQVLEKLKFGVLPANSEEARLIPREPIIPESQTAFDKFVESVEKSFFSINRIEGIKRYKENYLKTIDEEFGDDGKKLKELLEKMDADTLFNISINNHILKIRFISPPLDTENVIEGLYSEWSTAMEENKG
jgi:hypothetical protein